MSIEELSTPMLLDIADGSNTQTEFTSGAAFAELRSRIIPEDDEKNVEMRGGIRPEHTPNP